MASDTQERLNAHRFLSICDMLEDMPLELQEEALRWINYESFIRNKDPVHGCLGITRDLQFQIQQAEFELQYIQSQVAIYKDVAFNLSHQYSQYQRSFGGDGVVPLQVEESTSYLKQGQNDFQLGINYGCSSVAHCNSFLTDLNYNASVAAMDMSVVPLQYQRSFGGDGVVPLQVEESASHLQQSQHDSQLGINYGCSSGAHSNNSLTDLNYSASVAAMDIIVQHSTNETIDQPSGPPPEMGERLTLMERQARLLRYREKKQKRKFGKTTRYPSRKASAEIKPRIKGRFVKRITEAEAKESIDKRE